MKKQILTLISLIILSSLTTSTFAQIVGIKGGLNLSNMVEKDDDNTYSDDYKINPGFHLGVIADLELAEAGPIQLYTETGLLVTTKGMRIKEEETFFEETAEIKASTNIIYLEIPGTVKGVLEINNDLNAYGIFGFGFGFALTGKVKAEATYNGDTEKETMDIDFGSGDNDMKRLDLSLILGAGIEIDEQFQVGLSLDRSLLNLANYDGGGYKALNNVIQLSFVYLLDM